MSTSGKSESDDDFDPIYCQNCGNDMPPVSEYCEECGVGVGTTGRSDNSVTTRLKASGLISAVLSLVFLPIILGPLSMVCGYLLYDRGEEAWGKGIAVVGFVGMVVGSVLAVILFSSVPL